MGGGGLIPDGRRPSSTCANKVVQTFSLDRVVNRCLRRRLTCTHGRRRRRPGRVPLPARALVHLVVARGDGAPQLSEVRSGGGGPSPRLRHRSPGEPRRLARCSASSGRAVK